MRRVIGKQIAELAEDQLAVMREQYPRALLDVGTGDGKHALRLASQRPDWLIIGLDANRDNLRRVAQRAAARPDRGGQPNLLFIWAAAEQLPTGLVNIDEVHVLMPWGSLLRGMLGVDSRILRGLASASRTDATLLCTLNLNAWRPPVREVGGTPEPTPGSAISELRPTYAEAGWKLSEAHYGSEPNGISFTTPWSRRLGARGPDLPVLVLNAQRCEAGISDGKSSS